MFVPVVMAGGTGSRLWPLSRQLSPKQFLKLDGDKTMLQATLERLADLSCEPAVLICNEEHRFMAAEQLRHIGVGDATILLEPEGRNTAPAIALAAIQAMCDGEDPVLLVLPADHLIQDQPAFQAAIGIALEQAEAGRLVTFGIQPSCPETGYGYVKAAPVHGNTTVALQVAEFVEKPDFATAQAYVDSNDYFWNSGMFMFRASRYLAELEAFRPQMLHSCRQAIAGAKQDLDFVRVDAPAFAGCASESIDYAVMEHTEDAVLVPLDAGWSDVGSWSALADVSAKDAEDNVLKGDVLIKDCQGILAYAEHRLVAAIGVDDLVIVETRDAVLVARKDRVQDVKHIVEELEQQGRTEHVNHREVYRPWGCYDSIDAGSRYQVKHITVKPGAKLSVQMHHHRAEHWIVVSGTAKVTNGDKTYLVTENQSTYIPIGQIHSLENPGRVPLELIEVQSGAYLGEDDIVRLEDLYGRG
ncbi:mannose-1-phosphate guanylyltransferase/mannose-6-phosphate isomerase [Marinobacterium rhizophilum]|uniref:mannose-1-phosphate guanylyltransferase n=1 Tax=Marinobacterium rhizophilum TaxID=420402 RepID=A0ABY5HSW2_9GAMM|nr:mannose-1-phosphate guanylyltransferase/mannose-6-phosphate isomerase [Marinobacterium rhizophilum]UTW14255.1 mannose-1-phosphate guanylyltransferase/mannose-6-phosphate isomerase [Marinobacterium rhizophilum]